MNNLHYFITIKPNKRTVIQKKRTKRKASLAADIFLPICL
jgi:hypothetical protein